MKAYHFLQNDMTTGAGNEPAWKVGETRTIKGELILCSRGYHSCKSWYDALQYAPGAMACIVEISGKTIKDTDKQVSSTRKLIFTQKGTGREIFEWFANLCSKAPQLTLGEIAELQEKIK